MSCEDEAPEGWIEALVVATAEFLPGVEVIPLMAINKAWRDGARTALLRGRWRPVFETLKIIMDEGADQDEDSEAAALFKDAWRLDGALALKAITEGGVACPRTDAADFLLIVEPELTYGGAWRGSPLTSMERVIRALEPVSMELLTDKSDRGARPIYDQWDQRTPVGIFFGTEKLVKILKNWGDPSRAGRFAFHLSSGVANRHGYEMSSHAEDGHPSCLDNALKETLHWSNRDEASRFMDAYCQGLATYVPRGAIRYVGPSAEKVARWCETTAKSIRARDEFLWRLYKKHDTLDKGVESMREGKMLPPPPDVCIEGVEPIKWGTKEYDDKYGEADRRERRRMIRMEAEACGHDFDALLAQAQAQRRARGEDVPDLDW